MPEIKYPYLPEGRKILYVSEKNRFMMAAKKIWMVSSCAKHSTASVVVKDEKIIGRGANAGIKTTVCFRWGSPTGTNYNPCKKICKQVGHSEVMAVMDAKNSGNDTKGADLYLYGHWWCCENCWSAIINAEIRNVYLLDGSWDMFNPEINLEMKNFGKPDKKYFNHFKKIHNEFAKTKYGKKLEKEIRYERYKPKAVSKKIWQEILGLDVNNLHHHLVMYDIANNFFKYNDQGTSGNYIFDYNERKLLIIASLIHDWGESVTGDITADLKNGKNVRKEFEAAKKIINEFSFGYKNIISKNDLQKAFDSVVIGKNKKLSRAFNAIERIGYLLTGIKAWEEGSNFYKNNSQFTKNLWWLTTNVFLNQVKELVKYSDKYPAVKFYLDKNRKKIDNIFAKMPEEIFLKYKKERVEKKEQFEEAKKVWVSSRDKIRY